MRKTLIIGANGFMGNHAVRALKDDRVVIAVSRKFSSKTKNVRYITGNLAESALFKRLPRQIDEVIYLAQSEYFRDFPGRALDIFQVNTVAVLRALEYARLAQARTFIFASSGGLCKNTNDESFARAHSAATKDISFYLSTKLCSEILAKNYDTHMNIVLLRFFFVYGPNQKNTMLIPRLMDSVRSGNPIRLDGKNGIKINPTHVSDAVSAIKSALSLKGSHTIDIAGPKVYTMRQIVEIIGRMVKKKPIFKIKRNIKPKHIVGDISIMSKFLKAPRIPFEEGIKSLI